MDKSNKILIGVIIFCVLAVVGFCTFLILNKDDKVMSDALKFKEEYESLNNLEIPDTTYKYMELEIDESNPMVYKTGKEILDVLAEETTLVYFGFATCPWCRNIVNPLIEMAKKNNVAKVYYVDILDIRDQYEYNNSLIPKQTKKGTDAYYDILEFFGDKLDRFYVTDEDGNRYDTGVTRLYAPTVIAIKDGKIVDMHVATVETHTDPLKALTKEESDELKQIYQRMIDQIDINTCSEDGC